MKQVITYIILLLFVGCNSLKEEKHEANSKIVYDMYERSEMANLMNDMFEYNLKIKNEILNGQIKSEFPLDFYKIHSAELSDFKYRNDTFKAYSKVFIRAEKEVFNEESTIPLEQRFNNAVGVCISCHQTECTGPIPRIKKLLIQ